MHVHAYNLCFNVLDTLNRTRYNFWGGVYTSLDKVQEKKEQILKEFEGARIAFEIYPLESKYYNPFNL